MTTRQRLLALILISVLTFLSSPTFARGLMYQPRGHSRPEVLVRTDYNASALVCGGIHDEQDPESSPPGVKAEVKSGQGLETTTFETAHGKIRVYLPDDMAAGDTISGTVIAEPKGSTEEDRGRNADMLKGYVVEIQGTRASPDNRTFQFVIPAGATFRPGLNLVMRDTDAVIANAPLLAISAAAPSAPTGFRFPDIGQQGRPVEISGPFDGALANTSLKVGDQDVLRLAESPRKVVFQNPARVTGPVEITVKEGDVETKGQYRNVVVRLSAPKTNLRKGERTTVTIEVVGLEGIQQNVPLELESTGVVSMEGGNMQRVQIRPKDVRADGRFAQTRTLTGQQAGSFSVTATITKNTDTGSSAFFNESGAMKEDQCATMAGDVDKIKEKIAEKEKELAGLPEARDQTAKEIEQCKADLAQARKDLEQAEVNFQKQKNLLTNAQKSNDPRATEYQEAFNAAKKALEDAKAKVAELQKKCRDLQRKLDALGTKEKSLPGEIEDLKRRLKGLEEQLAAWKAEVEKKKQEEEKKGAGSAPDQKPEGAQPGAGGAAPGDTKPEEKKPEEKKPGTESWFPPPPEIPDWLQPWWEAVQNIVPGSELANLPGGKDTLGGIIKKLNNKILEEQIKDVDGKPNNLKWMSSSRRSCKRSITEWSSKEEFRISDCGFRISSTV